MTRLERWRAGATETNVRQLVNNVMVAYESSDICSVCPAFLDGFCDREPNMHECGWSFDRWARDQVGDVPLDNIGTEKAETGKNLVAFVLEEPKNCKACPLAQVGDGTTFCAGQDKGSYIMVKDPEGPRPPTCPLRAVVSPQPKPKKETAKNGDNA